LNKLTDEELMTQVANGNLDAMAYIFERYNVRIYNFLFQMIRDVSVCEDLTQNVFYKVIKYKHSYKGGKFISWIFKIARNIFSDYYQKQKKTQNFEDIDAVAKHEEENVLEKEENRNHLLKLLNTLKKEEKELIVMNRLQEIKYEQIAEILDSTPGAVKTKVCRIIKKLRIEYFQNA
jgi:RNA polymerase sigma-70 factor (ECF subfamily)